MTTFYQETIDHAREQCQPAVALFNARVSEAFDDRFIARARFMVILGPVLIFEIHEKKYANNIIHNAKARFHAMVHLSTTSNFGRNFVGEGLELTNVDAELINTSYELRNNGLKYRKIKSKDGLTSLAAKVADWVIKNKEIFEKSL